MTTAVGQPLLIERDAELTTARGMLADARRGRGGVVVVEAPAGSGKTALLRALRREATQAGLRVLVATGAALERDYPFGVVRQLFEAELLGADGDRRRELLRGVAALSESILGAATDDATVLDALHARLRGLFWLTANLADESPLLLVVDDAHWSDAPSLRFVDVLARRVEDLPVVVAVATRPEEPGSEDDILDALSTGHSAVVLRLGSLSPEGVATLIRDAVGEHAEDAFVRTCVEVTAGNPLLVRELCRALVADGRTGSASEAEAVRAAVPGTITRLVVSRVRRLSPAALALARSLAVLGGRATHSQAVQLAAVPAEAAGAAHAMLVRAGLVDPGGVRFVHPLVREAVYADLIGERSRWHHRAARVLADGGARDDEIAVHLLATDPEGDEWAAGVLATAGRRALADGVPEVARRLLLRALAETRSEDAPLLLDLGIAESRTQIGSALARLEAAEAAAERAGDAATAARAVQAQASVLIMTGRAYEAPEALRRHVNHLADVDPALAEELEDDLLDTLPHSEHLVPEYRARINDPAARQRPSLLSHLAWERASTGAPRDVVVDIGRRAIAGGELARCLAAGRFTHFYVIAALVVADAPEDAAQALDQGAEAVRRSGSPVAAASLGWMQSIWEREFGDLRRAEDHARSGLELFEEIAASGGSAMSSVCLASALVDRGQIEAADAVMSRVPPAETDAYAQVGIHAARARIRFEQGRYAEALDELDQQARIRRFRGRIVDDREPVVLRSLVLAALDRLEEARAVADAELELARRRGVAGAESCALLARASTHQGEAGLADLAAAVEAARRSPSTQRLARALAAHGARLRRAGQRKAAREPLREARELARRCGATALEEFAHEELVVAGARPQRIALAGVDALTAAERRVAELAAQGLRNRDIAETLFVTVKTVEVHLGHVYGKLGIRGRSQLGEALGGLPPA